jgi:hypothetical protein
VDLGEHSREQLFSALSCIPLPATLLTPAEMPVIKGATIWAKRTHVRGIGKHASLTPSRRDGRTIPTNH